MPTLTPSSEDLRIYEVAILYPHSISQKEEQQLLKEIGRIFEEAAGKEVARDLWGHRGLAYPIKGEIEGRFAIFHYEVPPEKLDEIDEALRILPGVLRHMMVKPPKGYEIMKYSEKYEQWLKEEQVAEEKAEREKEEKLRKKVVERARRQEKKADTDRKETKPAKKLSEGELEQQLEKLISDEDLNI